MTGGRPGLKKKRRGVSRDGDGSRCVARRADGGSCSSSCCCCSAQRRTPVRGGSGGHGVWRGARCHAFEAVPSARSRARARAESSAHAAHAAPAAWALAQPLSVCYKYIWYWYWYLCRNAARAALVTRGSVHPGLLLGHLVGYVSDAGSYCDGSGVYVTVCQTCPGGWYCPNLCNCAPIECPVG